MVICSLKNYPEFVQWQGEWQSIEVQRRNGSMEKRRIHDVVFKAKVILLAVKGEKKLAQIVWGYGIHQAVLTVEKETFKGFGDLSA